MSSTPNRAELGLVGVTWIAEQMNVGDSTVRKWIKNGRFPDGQRTPGGIVMYDRWLAERYIEKLQLEREAEALDWDTAADAPEWEVFRITERSWGVLHHDEVVFYAQTREQAVRYMASQTEGERVA